MPINKKPWKGKAAPSVSAPPPVSNRPIKTLDRVLSKAGLGSRNDARTWIGDGRVCVNGRVIREPDHWVDLERDKVTLDEKPVRAGDRLYILLYKPKGYITTYKDPEGRQQSMTCWAMWGTGLCPSGGSIRTPAACY